MKKKAKITQKQADAIKIAVADYGSDIVLDDHSLSEDAEWSGVLAPLNSLSPSLLARALYVGYEIEPDFKAGDWVVYKKYDGTVIGQIYENTVGDFDIDRAEKTGMSFNSSDWRHATDDEIKSEMRRRLWMQINRTPGEFRERDFGYAKKGTLVGGKTMLETYYERDILAGFFPEDSYVDLGDDE